jgi:hypothetical protein
MEPNDLRPRLIAICVAQIIVLLLVLAWLTWA